VLVIDFKHRKQAILDTVIDRAGKAKRTLVLQSVPDRPVRDTQYISKLTLYFSAFSCFLACEKLKIVKVEKLIYRKYNILANLK
jgi:hypothetical protein